MSQHVRLLSPRCESHVHIYPEQDHQLESRMREIRQSGSEGGGGREASPYPYQSFAGSRRRYMAEYMARNMVKKMA